MLVNIVWQIIKFINFEFWNDENVTGGFGMNIEKGENAVVFVNFVTRNFATIFEKILAIKPLC